MACGGCQQNRLRRAQVMVTRSALARRWEHQYVDLDQVSTMLNQLEEAGAVVVTVAPVVHEGQEEVLIVAWRRVSTGKPVPHVGRPERVP